MNSEFNAYLDAKVRVLVLARRYNLSIRSFFRRPNVQAFLASLGLSPIGDLIHSEQLEVHHWQQLEQWMHARISQQQE